jgi:hypothetical protein
MALVRERTIPTERLPLVGEDSAMYDMVCTVCISANLLVLAR